MTTALTVELPASMSDDTPTPPLFGRLPLPRIRPASAPRPPEPNSQQDVCETLAASARQHRLPIAFFGNLIYQESGLKPRVVSRAGARGIAQFMPKTARMVGLKDPFNPRQALPASAKFLRGLLHRFGNNYGLAAAAYNAGPGRVSRWLKRGGALPHETRNYVQTITGKRADQWRGARGNQYAGNLTGRIPCANLKAFAELENNPASANSLQPVRFVLPVPLPNPLRVARVAASEEPQLTVNLTMRLPSISLSSSAHAAEAPTASIPPALPPAAPLTIETTAAETRVASAEPVVPAVTETQVAAIKNPPAPRPDPHRTWTQPSTETDSAKDASRIMKTAPEIQVAALVVPMGTNVARIKNAPTPRPSPLRQGDETGSVAPALDSGSMVAPIGIAPMPRANPRRMGDDVARLQPSDLAKLPLPRAHPLKMAQAAKKK